MAQGKDNLEEKKPRFVVVFTPQTCIKSVADCPAFGVHSSPGFYQLNRQTYRALILKIQGKEQQILRDPLIQNGADLPLVDMLHDLYSQ